MLQDSLGVSSPPRQGASTSSTLTSPWRPSATARVARLAAPRESSTAGPTPTWRRPGREHRSVSSVGTRRSLQEVRERERERGEQTADCCDVQAPPSSSAPGRCTLRRSAGDRADLPVRTGPSSATRLTSTTADPSWTTSSASSSWTRRTRSQPTTGATPATALRTGWSPPTRRWWTSPTTGGLSRSSPRRTTSASPTTV